MVVESLFYSCQVRVGDRTVPYPLCHQGHGSLHCPNQSHAVVDAPWTKPPLGYLKATPFTQQQVAHGHADIVKHDLRVSVWKNNN